MRTVLAAACAFAGVLAAQQQDPILARLSAETTNVVVVRDPLPVLERLLASPALGKLLEDTAQLQRTFAGRAFDAASLQRQLALVAPMVPVEIVIAAPTRTMDRLSHAAPLFVCGSVLQILARAKVTDDGTLAKVRAAALDHLGHLDSLPLQAWVRARDERTAENWFDVLAKEVPVRAKELGLAASVAGERIELRGEPFAKGSMLRRELEAAGIAMDKAPVWTVDATIEQRGPVIELRAGKLAPPPCTEAQLGTAWRADAGQLLFARSEVSDGVVYLTAVYSAIAGLGDVDLDDGDTELMVRLLGFLNRVDALTVDQTATLRVEQGVAWEHETRHEIAPAAGEADVPAALARLLRPDDGPFAITCDTLDAFVVAMIDSLLEPADGSYSFGSMMRTQWSDAIEFFDSEESAVFAPGCAVLTRAATLPAAGDRPARRIAGLALVAPLVAADAAEGFMMALGEHVAEGTAIAAPSWRKEDLGLGVPTWALDLAELAPSLRPFVHAGAFAPHWFVAEGLLVLSTDPSLSKELIERARSEPRALPHARLATWAQARGEHLHGALTAMSEWPELAGVVKAAVTAAAAALAEVELVETVSWVDGTVARERTSIRLRGPAPK